MILQVGTNGIISFGEPFTFASPQPFPTVFPFIYENYLLAPFWADVDISPFFGSINDGSIKYEVHTTASNFSGSIDLIGRVSNFISNKTETTFEGSWMLVALWDEVPPFGGVFGQEVRIIRSWTLAILYSCSDSDRSIIIYKNTVSI